MNNHQPVPDLSQRAQAAAMRDAGLGDITLTAQDGVTPLVTFHAAALLQVLMMYPPVETLVSEFVPTINLQGAVLRAIAEAVTIGEDGHVRADAPAIMAALRRVYDVAGPPPTEDEGEDGQTPPDSAAEPTPDA